VTDGLNVRIFFCYPNLKKKKIGAGNKIVQQTAAILKQI
jgi:hypothetical protein